MSHIQNILLTASFLLWGGVALSELARRDHKARLIAAAQLVLIAALAWSLHRWFGYYNTLEIRAPQLIGEGWLLIGLYLSTILGISAHHVFIQIKGVNERGRRRKLKWRPLLKPLVISPIIFLAVLSQINKMGAQADTITAAVTQCIVAFQNGFFWKTVIEHIEPSAGKEGRTS